MKVYHVETQQAYDTLMTELEEKGCKWVGGEKLTDFDEFSTYEIDTYVYDECCKISISSGNYFKEYHSDEPVIEYKAKGENMTQEEIKRNLQKIAFDVSVAIESFARDIPESESDLQEAKSFAKKLIEKIDEYLESQKPDFKVGDYVTINVNGRTKIAKIDKLWEHTAEAHGLWYDQTKVNVKQDFWFLAEGNEFRHATPSEIEEYEVALTFHKNGRKPFEVKDGDILRDDKGNVLISDDDIFSADSPKNLKKEYFIRGRYTFLKTVEEVNKWLLKKEKTEK